MRLNYTVIGDAVNIASRLESTNKAYGSTIIIGPETRRLMDPLFMALFSQGLLFEARCSSSVSAALWHRLVADAQFNLLGKFYDQTEAARKGASQAGAASYLFRPRDRSAVPIFAGGIFELLPAALDHRR